MTTLIFVYLVSGKIANLAESNGRNRALCRIMVFLVWSGGALIFGLPLSIIGETAAKIYLSGGYEFIGGLIAAVVFRQLIKRKPESIHAEKRPESRGWICRVCGYENTSLDAERCFDCHKPRV